ncbi:MAG: c-type cytochrome [Bacteroidia bacterium]
MKDFFKHYIYQIIFSFLVCTYLVYSFIVYFSGHGKYERIKNESAMKGQVIWQKKNCQACHQIYGLGGFMGPDLTNYASSPKGFDYAKMILQTGTLRMPRFYFTNEELENLTAYLIQVDESGKSVVMPENIDIFGNYSIKGKKNE